MSQSEINETLESYLTQKKIGRKRTVESFQYWLNRVRLINAIFLFKDTFKNWKYRPDYDRDCLPINTQQNVEFVQW